MNVKWFRKAIRNGNEEKSKMQMENLIENDNSGTEDVFQVKCYANKTFAFN